MAYLGAILLLNLDRYETFQALCNMLNRRCHLAFSKQNIKVINSYKEAFQELLADCLPAIRTHLYTVGIEADVYLFDWFVTLFARALPLEVASRIWDVYFIQGEIHLFRAALGILQMIEKRILGHSFDSILSTLTHPLEVDEDDYFTAVSQIPLSEKKFSSVMGKFFHK